MNHASYILSAYSSLKFLTLEQLLQVGNHQTEGHNPIPSFDEDLLISLCIDTINIVSLEDSVLEIDGNTYIVGDIHGSFHDLLRILNYMGSNPSKVVFLGDYVDRGCFSLECITLLFTLKVLYPTKFYLLRGNHEFDAMCSQYGFKKELLNYHNPKKMSPIPDKEVKIKIQPINTFNFEEEEETKESISHETRCDNYFANHINMNCYKYTEKLYNAFIRAFSYLPIAAIVNKTTFCIHGGLSPQLDRIDKISRLIRRPIDNIDKNTLLTDLLWGDPSHESTHFFTDNPRGRGKLFNGINTLKFLKDNNLTRLVRAHQCVNHGIEEAFNDKCITVFSASSYNKNMGNKSGILTLFVNDTIEKVAFTPIPRLQKYDALYYKVRAFHEDRPSKPVLSQFNVKKFRSVGFIPDQLNGPTKYTFNSTDDNDLDVNPEPRKPILVAKSTRLNSHYAKPDNIGKTISFNTGTKYRKSLGFNVTPKGDFLNIKSKNEFESDSEMINATPTQPHLPFLKAKATI